MTKHKSDLFLLKQRLNMNVALRRHGIIPLVNRAWKESFARKASNFRAILERGWYHLDRRLLKDPEILQTKFACNAPPNENECISGTTKPCNKASKNK